MAAVRKFENSSAQTAPSPLASAATNIIFTCSSVKQESTDRMAAMNSSKSRSPEPSTALKAVFRSENFSRKASTASATRFKRIKPSEPWMPAQSLSNTSSTRQWNSSTLHSSAACS
eukprot:CAMPEP_0115476064 /NCGR_PEP_ID=MMETSP0271-20121206/54940_1 /TAXON_ID=71861 /ORGANISM="Scrippsiella trochoidea, Strain CCMP3099" /LENGTH=115 /DNA_ID=CAMNT_0002903457 /DNA_START=410 /DNA_END=757 /DNA_ORIENTATION=-